MRASRNLVGTLVAVLVAATLAGCSDPAGTESVSLIVSLRNLTDQPVNLVHDNEAFGQGNLIAAQTMRIPPPISTVKQRTHEFRAGLNGEVLHTVSCIVPQQTDTPRHNARVDWNGTVLTCGTGW